MPSDKPIVAYIGLGANLGDRANSIRLAIDLLKQSPGIKVTAVSSFLENPAVGGPPNAPAFLNAVVQLKVTIGSHDLLHCLLEIETQLGRVRRVRWEPRSIDLDLLLYGDQIISSQELIVPHPLMHQRRFVLQPLAEIAPKVMHPTLRMTALALLHALTPIADCLLPIAD